MPTLSEIAAARHARRMEEIRTACHGIEVSLFSDAFDTDATTAALGDVLVAIASGDVRDIVEKLRSRLANGDRKAYDMEKRKLPGVTLSAILATRDKDVPISERVERHSGILQADFDGKDNPQLTPAETRDALKSDPHVLAAFVSPSGEGVKALVRIPARIEDHAAAFDAAKAHYMEKFGLAMDRAARDIGRLCFLSWDPDLWVNAAAVAIEPTQPELPARRSGPTSKDWADTYPATLEDVREMLSFIPSMRGHYDDWLKITNAVWSVVPLAESLPMLQSWTPPKNPGDYEKKWRSRLNTIGIGTLAHYAQQYGFDAKAAARRKMWAGRIRFADGSRTAEKRETVAEEPPAQIIEMDREFVWSCVERGQRGDAELWARMASGAYCFDHLAQAWRRYEGGIWEKDDTGATRIEFIDRVCGAYQELADSILDEINRSPSGAEKDPRRAKIASIQKRIAKLNNAGYSAAALDLAASVEALRARATDFDREAHLLALADRTVDFHAGEVREHRPGDKMTKRIPVKFNAAAECPAFDRFLHLVMGGDEAMIAYIWRAIGYSLTGFVDRDVLFFLWGKGANGKSTFTSALKLLGGDYMTTIDIESLLAKRADNNLDYKKAMLEGTRLVVTDEIPEGRRLNEAMIKALVGGDDIVARRPYEKPYVFPPTHKLWMVGNHKPTITGTDLGIWRRIHLVPFTVTIPEADRRPRHEVLAEFRKELPGILRGALAGYQEMLDLGGLNPPEKVIEAVKEYKSDSDQFALFLADRTERNITGRVELSELLRAYLAWCEDEGEEPLAKSSRRLGVLIKERGISLEMDGHKSRMALGLTLLSQDFGKTSTRHWND
jgi:P4 family phage/plasmid primase-like protien